MGSEGPRLPAVRSIAWLDRFAASVKNHVLLDCSVVDLPLAAHLANGKCLIAAELYGACDRCRISLRRSNRQHIEREVPPLRYKALYLRAVVARNGVAMRSNDRDVRAGSQGSCRSKSEDDAHAHGSNENKMSDG